MSSIVEIQGVDQSFRAGFWMKRTQILHDIHLRIPERSIFGFLGANGAGKTTLIHLMVGLKRPVRGQVRVFGLDASTPEARARLGYLPERPYFYDHLKGDDLLQYFGALSGMKRSMVLSRIPAIMAAVGMSEARQVELRRYSKGMLQRIGIAQALIHDPEFLILDEPMSGLDPVGRKEIRELIVRLASEGRTIFFSTHIIPDVEAICDQVALIRKGKMVGSGSIQELLSPAGSQTELTWSGPESKELSDPSVWPEFASIRRTSEGYRAILRDTGAVNSTLERLLSQGARISSVTPLRSSLEEYFQNDSVLSVLKEKQAHGK